MSGANSSASSAWKLDTSQTTVTSSPSSPASDDSGVPTLPATSTGKPGGAPDGAEQLGRRRLAVGARHGDEASRQEPPGELELAEHRQAELARARDHGGLVRHARALDDAGGAVEQLDAVALQHGLDPGGRLRASAVHPDHLPVCLQHARRRDP